MANIRWHYQTSGSSQNPRILFLHGFLGSLQDWEAIIGKFQQNFFCVSVDLPGHGNTPNPVKNYSFAETGDDLANFLTEMNFAPVSVIGYSMGGRLALYLALQHLYLINKIVLESTSPGLPTARERINRAANDNALAEKMVKMDFGLFLQDWYNQPLFDSLRRHPDFEMLLKNRQRNDPGEMAKALISLGTGKQPSLWKFLPQNKIPMLLLVGELDDKYRRIAGQMCEKCSFCSMKVIKDAGHNIHFEKPDEFANSCLDFLSGK